MFLYCPVSMLPCSYSPMLLYSHVPILPCLLLVPKLLYFHIPVSLYYCHVPVGLFPWSLYSELCIPVFLSSSVPTFPCPVFSTFSWVFFFFFTSSSFIFKKKEENKLTFLCLLLPTSFDFCSCIQFTHFLLSNLLKHHLAWRSLLPGWGSSGWMGDGLLPFNVPAVSNFSSVAYFMKILLYFTGRTLVMQCSKNNNFFLQWIEKKRRKK